MLPTQRRALFIVCVSTIGLARLAITTSRAEPLGPTDAVPAILDLFTTHPIVAVDEHHGEMEGHSFRLALLRDPRFLATVDAVVVEFGNARYQETIDRFVAGDDVPYEALRRVWQNATMATAVWDRPIYEDFFRAIRTLNLSSSGRRRLRVLLGDPPIDWDRITTTSDLEVWRARRNSHPARVIEEQVHAKRHRALVIYGTQHLWRGSPSGESLVDRVERATDAKVFTVMTTPAVSPDIVEPDVTRWRAPAIGFTQGTVLEKQVDAVLYLGPSKNRTMSSLTAALCREPEYVRMRERRMALANDARGIEVFRGECRTPGGLP